RLRDSQLKPAHWADLKKALEGHERALEALRAERSVLQSTLQATERRRRILGPAATRRHRLGQLAALEPVPDFPADAGELLDRAVRQILESAAIGRLATQQAETARAQLAGLSFDVTLLSHRSGAMALRAQLGAVEKAIADAPGLQAKVSAAGDQLN